MQQKCLAGRPQRTRPPVFGSVLVKPTCRQRSRTDRKSPKVKGTTRLVVRAGPVEINDEDLLQYPDRLKWYETKFCADDMPDWNPGRFVRSQQIAPGVKAVVLECEISRERVPLRNAYKCVGQRASVRINHGIEHKLTVSCAPFPMELNKEPLFKVRGDLFAHEIKIPKEPSSVMAELHLLVSKEEAPDVYAADEDCIVEVGPFAGTGINLRDSGLLAIYRYPTLVIFTEGKGIATTRALVESTVDVCNLTPKLRKDVRVYYKAQNQTSMLFRDCFEGWKKLGIEVHTTTSSFSDAFDDDDTLTYDPDTTGAIILVDGDKEAEAAARAVCKEAEITAILTDEDMPATVHMDSTPSSFRRWSALSSKAVGNGADE